MDGKTLIKSAPGLVGDLHFGRSKRAQNNRRSSRVGSLNDFRTHDGRHNKCRARFNCFAAHFRGHDRTRADNGLLTETLAGFADEAEGVGRCHGDLERVHSAGD